MSLLNLFWINVFVLKNNYYNSNNRGEFIMKKKEKFLTGSLLSLVGILELVLPTWTVDYSGSIRAYTPLGMIFNASSLPGSLTIFSQLSGYFAFMSLLFRFLGSKRTQIAVGAGILVAKFLKKHDGASLLFAKDFRTRLIKASANKIFALRGFT